MGVFALHITDLDGSIIAATGELTTTRTTLSVGCTRRCVILLEWESLA